MREICRILYIRTDRMGDVLMNLPAVRRLRQTFPKAWITLMVDTSVAELLRSHPDIDEIMAVSWKEIQKSVVCQWKLIQKVRKIKFDLAVVSNPHKFLHVLTWLGRIPRRLGINRKWGFLLTKTIRDSKSGADRHEIDRNLELAGLISDKNWDGKLALPVDEKSKRAVEQRLAQESPDAQNLIAIHAGTSNPKKRWPIERFVALCRQIQSRWPAATLILIGGSEEIFISENLAKQLPTPVLDWTGRLGLQQLTAFLSHPNLKTLVSADSGPVHIAWMQGTPVVALYAQNTDGSNPVRWGPRDKKSAVIHKPMGEITVAETMEALLKVLGP